MRQRALRALLFAIAFVLGGSMVGLSIHSSADTVAIVRPDPAEVGVALGDSATVAVWVEDVADLYGAQIHLRFDPSIVEVQDADPDKDGVQVRPGDFLDPAQGFVAANQVDNEAGELVYAITLVSPASPANGSDVLIWIDFVTLAVGRSEWILQEVILATRDGASTPVEVGTGCVVVEDGQSTPSSPTITPAPSSSVVAPMASLTPTPGAANTSLPTSEPSDAFPTSTTASPKLLTSEPVGMISTGDAVGTEQAALLTGEEQATASPSSTHWPTLAVPTRVPGAQTTPGAENSGVQAALPVFLAAAGAVLVLAVGLYLYRRRRRQQERQPGESR